MKVSFKRLLSCLLAVLMVVASFTFSVSAATYADVSTVSSATITEIDYRNPLTYEVGDTIVAKFQIKNGSTVLTAPSVYYSAVMDDGRTLTGNVTPVDGVYTITLEGGLRRPGFVLMNVYACDANGNKYTKDTNPKIEPYGFGAGANIDEIQSIYGVPDAYSEFGDFDAFWEETLASMGTANLTFFHECGEYTFNNVTYDCYEIEINCAKDEYYKDSWGGDNHVMAYLTIPQGKTNLGAQVLYKGYDWISASGTHDKIEPQAGICNANKITLSVSPHSIPAPHNVAEADKGSAWVKDDAYIGNYYKASSGGYLYDTYKYSASHGKNETENNNPNTTYFKYMLMRDVQAVNFLKLYFGSTVAGYESWAGIWDGENILTNGASQGGYQALAVAGLVPEVNSVSAGVPWFGDQGVTSADSDRYKPTSPRNFPYGEGLRYVDTANLASRISTNCNVSINAGLKDTLVPPSTVMSIYDLLNCNVTLNFQQNMGHGGSGQYSNSISKTANTSEKSHTFNFNGLEGSFETAFKAAWDKVCGEKVVSVDVYAVDKNTDIDFKALATSSTADAIGVVLTGNGLTNINAKLAEIYALHNDVNSKVWVIENDNSLNGTNAAIALDACMNWGDRPTTGGSIKLYTADGELGQTSVLGANVNYAVIPSPLWVSAQGILVDTTNVSLEDGKITTSIGDASIKLTAPAYSATYDMVGVGDSAYGNIDGVGIWIADSEGVLTIKGAGAVPAYGSYSDAPWSSRDITKVVVVDGITSIGANAFAISGAEIELPKSVASIDASAVASDATIVSYDNAYAKTYASANSIAFTNLGAIGTIGTDLNWYLDLGTGVFTVKGAGTAVFAQDEAGNKISPESPWTSTNWKSAQHYNYQSKVKKVVIEAPVTSIQGYCFTFFDACTTFELPTTFNSTTGYCVFNGMTGLNCVYTTGQTPEVGTANFSNMANVDSYTMVQTAVTKVILNNNVKTIGTQAFYGCTKLTEINIPSKLDTIGKQAFINCTGLTELALPASTTTVDSTAFEGCSNIKTLTVLNQNLDMNFADKLTGLTKIIAPAGSTANTYATNNSKTFEAYEDVIASGECGTDLYWKLLNENGVGVLKILGTGTKTASGSGGWSSDQSKESKSVFWPYRNQINVVKFGDSVTNIGSLTFYALPGITTVELTENIKTIEGSAFGNCTNLSTIYIKGNEPVVGTYDLTNITSMPNGYQFDGSGKTTLKEVKLSSALTGDIGDKFVSYNSSLTSITIPAGVTGFSQRTIHRCSALKEITFLGNTSIPDTFLFHKEEQSNDSDATKGYITYIDVVNAPAGSSAEAWVATANAKYESLGISHRITFKALATDPETPAEPTVIPTGKAGENLTWKIVSENGENVMYVQGTGSVMRAFNAETQAYETEQGYGKPAYTKHDWAAYCADVKKLVIEAPVTQIYGYNLAQFDSCHTVVLPTAMTQLKNDSCFNDMAALSTVYTAGQTPEVGTANLSNISSIAGYSFVKAAFKKIIFKENVSIGDYAFTWNANLESVEIPNGATISVTAFSGNDNYTNPKTVTYADKVATVVYKPFLTYSEAKPNSSITTIVVNNPSAAFEGCSSSDYSAFLNGLPELTTVKGYSGSTAEAMVTWANANGRTIKFVSLGGETVKSGEYQGVTWTVKSLANGNYSVTLDGAVTALPAASSDWGLDAYKSNVIEVVIKAPITATGTSIKDLFANVQTVELPTSCKKITAHAFNSSKSLKTIYTTGQDAVAGTFNLSNITSIESWSLVFNALDTIIVGNNCVVNSNAMFWSPNLKKIVIGEGATIGAQAFVTGNTADREWDDTVVEFPESMSAVPYEAFYGNQETGSDTRFVNSRIKEIIVKNPNAVFAKVYNSTANDYEAFITWVTGLETVKGMAGSTAEEFVNWANDYYADNNIDKTIKFVAIDTVVDGMPIGDGVWYRLIDNGNDTYTMDIYGNGTTIYAADANGNKVAMSWELTTETRNFNAYASKITKIKFSAPNVTNYQGYMFRGTNVTHIEFNPNQTVISGSSAFNGIAKVSTVYVTGNEPVEGVADLTNFTSFDKYSFVNHKFKKIVLSDKLKEIPYYCFGSDDGQAVLESVVIPASVTSLEDYAFAGVKNMKLFAFENNNFTYSANTFKDIASTVTVSANPGSTGETFAKNNGFFFVDRLIRNVVEIYRNGDSAVVLDKVDAYNITAYAISKTSSFSFGYNNYGNAVEVKTRPWNDYKNLITKVIFAIPTLTEIVATFATHDRLTTVEIPASVTTIRNSAFNAARVTTLYVTGNEPQTGVIDLTNITKLESLGFAHALAHTILFNDDLIGTFGNFDFFNCSNLTYLRFPKGITGVSGDPFHNLTALTTILVENPDFAFSSDAFKTSVKLETVIAHKYKSNGVLSDAWNFAQSKGYTFIPLDNTADLLTFEGFEIRETGYNGLRSIFSASLEAMNALEAKGLKVVEFGSLLASTDKLNAAEVELTVAKNAEGKYVSHDFALVAPIYQNGVKVGLTLYNSDTEIRYAYTVTNFSASNYTKNVTFRGYIVYEDKEGNNYIVYADLIGEDGNNYNSTNLEAVCAGMIEDGRDLSTNVCWLDILKFRGNLDK